MPIFFSSTYLYSLMHCKHGLLLANSCYMPAFVLTMQCVIARILACHCLHAFTYFFFFFSVLQVVIFAKHFDKRFWSTLTSMETVFVRSHLAHVVLCAFCIASPGSECAFCWSLHLQCVFIWIFFSKFMHVLFVFLSVVKKNNKTGVCLIQNMNTLILYFCVCLVSIGACVLAMHALFWLSEVSIVSFWMFVGLRSHMFSIKDFNISVWTALLLMFPLHILPALCFASCSYVWQRLTLYLWFVRSPRVCQLVFACDTLSYLC